MASPNGVAATGDVFGARAAPLDLLVEMISAGILGSARRGTTLSRQSFDDMIRRYGFKVIDNMLADPAVAACFGVLKEGIVSTGMQLTPAIEATPGVPDEAQDPLVAESREITEFCRDMHKLMERPIDEVSFAMLDGMAYGCRLAELVWRKVTWRGKSRLMLERLAPKPRQVWAFVVDPFLRPVGVLALSVPTGDDGERGQPTFEIIPVEKAFIYTWIPKDGDPRGTTMLRPAYEPWNKKRHTLPDHFELMAQFGRPRIVIIQPEAMVARYPIDPHTGLEDRTKPRITPEQQIMQAVSLWEAGNVLNLPHGSQAVVIEPKSDGQGHIKSMRFDDEQIALAILGNTRTIMEAENGSRADSVTAQDITRGRQAFGQLMYARSYERQVLHRAVALNFGDDAAAIHTPIAGFGDSSAEDFAVNATAVAALNKGGWFQDDQKPWIDARKLNILVRKPMTADQLREKQRQEQSDAADSGKTPKDGAKDRKGRPVPSARVALALAHRGLIRAGDAA